jgi:hypothetical protein
MVSSVDINSLFQTPVSELVQQTVQGVSAVPSYGLKPDLYEHACMLRDEFIGKRAILLYHALLNVRLRRQIELPDTISRFRNVWLECRPILLSELDSRWLISACDSMIDHFEEPEERLVALAAVLMMNTIKLYETERLACGQYQSQITLDKPALQWQGRHELFNGVSAFAIGQGDMVKNMLKRVDLVLDLSTFASPILAEITRRINRYDTVYKRLGDVHVNSDTIWQVESDLIG